MVRLSAMLVPEKISMRVESSPMSGEGEMFPRRGQPARSEQVLRVDVPGGDACGRNAGRGERMPDGVDSAFVGDHGGDGEAGHAFVQHFGVHAIVEDVFGLVERFFPGSRPCWQWASRSLGLTLGMR